MAYTVHKEISIDLGVSSKVSFLKQKRSTHSLKAAECLVDHLIFILQLGAIISSLHVLLELSTDSGIENRVMELVGHSDQLWCAEQKLGTHEGLHLILLPTPREPINVQEEPESTCLNWPSTLYTPGHLSPSSFLPTRVKSVSSAHRPIYS